MKQVCFRVDGGLDIGAGHLMRCLTMASALKKAGWRCFFIVSDTTLDFMPSLTDCGHDIVSTKDAPPHVDVLVVDHYGLDHDYETPSRDWAKIIFVIDDLADRDHDCDILLDQTYNRHDEDYQALVPDQCRLLLGAGYTLLRDEFRQKRQESLARRAKNQTIEKVLISLGQTNVHDITQKVLHDIQHYTGANLLIDVVLGRSAYNIDHVQSLIKSINKETSHTVSLHLGANNMADLMVQADIAIGSGGTPSWERCCLGLPALTIILADNQKKVLKELEEAGAIININADSDSEEDSITHCLEKLKKDGSAVIKMSQVASKICDGYGTSRVLKVIEGAIEDHG